MNALTWKGTTGDIRWSYHTAAALSRWEITGHTLTAHVVSHDTFKVSQRPLMFVVPRPNGQDWRWGIESLQITGSTLTASLAP